MYYVKIQSALTMICREHGPRMSAWQGRQHPTGGVDNVLQRASRQTTNSRNHHYRWTLQQSTCIDYNM